MEHIKLIRDSSQNRKSYQLPAAQLAICDIPYRLGVRLTALRSASDSLWKPVSRWKNISIDMFSMTESKYYQRQQSMATQTTLEF